MISPRDLRDIEAAAAPATSKAIRQALREAAEALEDRNSGAEGIQWQQTVRDAITTLEEIGNQRVSQTMTDHRAAEVMQEDKRRMLELAAQFRGLVGA